MQKAIGFTVLFASALASAAAVQPIDPGMVQRTSGSFTHLEPDGWATRVIGDPTTGVRIVMTPDTSNTVALILSTNLSPTAGPARQGVATILAKAGVADTPLAWEHEDSAGAEFRFAGAQNRTLFGRAVCSQGKEGGQIRITCGILNSASAEAFAASLSLRQIHAIVQSVRSASAVRPEVPVQPAVMDPPVQPTPEPTPADAPPPLPLGKWSTSESSPAYARYIQGGKLDFGGSGETLFLELGKKKSYRFVQAYTTSGPYFAGISIRDERGTFTAEGNTLTFHHRSCTLIVRSANNPLERSSCGKGDPLATLEIDPSADGQSLRIAGENLSFMGRNIERWTLHRVK